MVTFMTKGSRMTAGNPSRFGFPLFQLKELKKQMGAFPDLEQRYQAEIPWQPRAPRTSWSQQAQTARWEALEWLGQSVLPWETGPSRRGARHVLLSGGSHL